MRRGLFSNGPIDLAQSRTSPLIGAGREMLDKGVGRHSSVSQSLGTLVGRNADNEERPTLRRTL